MQICTCFSYSDCPEVCLATSYCSKFNVLACTGSLEMEMPNAAFPEPKCLPAHMPNLYWPAIFVGANEANEASDETATLDQGTSGVPKR